MYELLTCYTDLSADSDSLTANSDVSSTVAPAVLPAVPVPSQLNINASC
jgi:hypothetical protein